MGCDSLWPCSVSLIVVSIHAPAWGATTGEDKNTLSGERFNPRTRMGCDAADVLLYLTFCFNPRTRMGCDFAIPNTNIIYYVSIHAPAWGATHTLRPSARLRPRFQSTHPHGVRLGVASSDTKDVVSIHAPTWGATYERNATYKARMFQSTHPHGVRRECHVGAYIRHVFQSTHPHGVRRKLKRHLTPRWSFNPRTRMGCDRKQIKAHGARWFQSTHPHGVRQHKAHGYQKI